MSDKAANDPCVIRRSCFGSGRVVWPSRVRRRRLNAVVAEVGVVAGGLARPSRKAQRRSNRLRSGIAPFSSASRGGSRPVSEQRIHVSLDGFTYHGFTCLKTDISLSDEKVSKTHICNTHLQRTNGRDGDLVPCSWPVLRSRLLGEEFVRATLAVDKADRSSRKI